VEKKKLEQELVDAGWEVDHGFEQALLIGTAGNLSVLVPWWAWQSIDTEPVYELYDVQSEKNCWVREVSTPLSAKTLLEEHGKPATLVGAYKEEEIAIVVE
jgi:hypothetical protein